MAPVSYCSAEHVSRMRTYLKRIEELEKNLKIQLEVHFFLDN